MTLELSVHQDDTFPLAQSSGLDAVRMTGIDQKAHESRHLSYIRENIAMSKKSELKGLGL